MKNRHFMVITMLLISMFQMGMVALSPIVSSLTDVFAGTSDTAAQLAMTFMCLCIVLTALCSGIISRTIGRRLMCAGGMALTAAGGLIGIFLTFRLWMVFLCSAVLGIGTGLFVPAVSSMMIDYLSDEEREKVAGAQTAFVNLGGMLLSLLSGLAAAVCWNYAYAVYLLAVPMIFFALRSIPAEGRRPADQESGGASLRRSGRIPAVVWISALQTFLFAIFYFAFSTNISLLLEERSLGGTAAAGLAAGIFMVGGFAFGLLFSRMHGAFGSYMPGIAFFMLALSYLAVYASGNLIGILIAGFFGGGSLSVIFPYFLLHIAGRVDPSVSVISSSLILSVGPNLGSFVSPVILTTLAGFMDDTAGTRFMLASAAALILAIAALVFSGWERHQNKASEE